MRDPILVTLLKMRPHYSQSTLKNATPCSVTSPLASYKEVTPPPPRAAMLRRLSTRKSGGVLELMLAGYVSLHGLSEPLPHYSLFCGQL